MIKLFSLKDQQQNRGSEPAKKNQTAAHLRLQKDMNELDLPSSCKLDMDPSDLLNFKLTISLSEGYYAGGSFTFTFNVGTNYPHEAPKVKCITIPYHPNIDLEGNVCLNILREEWKPILTISSIIFGLQFLFLEPNPEDPLNKEAAVVLQQNKRLFEQNVHRAMRGGSVDGHQFQRCIP